MSSKGFRLPTPFQSHIKWSESGYPCLSILSGKPSDTSYVHLGIYLSHPFYCPPQTSDFKELHLHWAWQASGPTATAPHRKQVLLSLHTSSLCEGPGIPTYHMWPHFLNSHRARRGMETSWKHVFLCRSPVPRKQQCALSLGSVFHFLHYIHSSWVWGPHTHLQVKEEPKICKMPSSACLFLQGKPPQNQKVGHPEVLRVILIQQFFQAQNLLFFILIWSSNILVSSVSHCSLLFPTCIALLLSDHPFQRPCLFSRASCSVEPPCLLGSQKRGPQPQCTNFLSRTFQHLQMTWALESFSWFPFLAYFSSVIFIIGNVSTLVA